MQFMSVICSLMNIYTSLFFRIKLIFSIFQIISISYFWNIHHKNEMKIRKSLINKNSFFGLFILVLLTTRMFYSNMIKGNEEVLPYKTIFERDSREYLADIKKLEE